MSYEGLRGLIAHALASGARKTGSCTFEWCIAGNCERPYWRELHARPNRALSRASSLTIMRFGHDPAFWRKGRLEQATSIPGGRYSKPTHLALRMEVRCRKCPPCLRLRQLGWADRAWSEYQEHKQAGHRTWKLTLTFDADARTRLRAVAQHRSSKAGKDFEALSPDQQFAELQAAAGPEITRFLKRLRKRCGAVRYLACGEQHQDGFPHFHLLLHECEPGGITDSLFYGRSWDREKKRMVRERPPLWLCGSVQKLKLVDEGPDERKQVTYAAKYLSKSSGARVRASLGYGKSALMANRGEVNNTVDNKSLSKEGENIVCNTIEGGNPSLGELNNEVSSSSTCAPDKPGRSRLSTGSTAQSSPERPNWLNAIQSQWPGAAVVGERVCGPPLQSGRSRI